MTAASEPWARLADFLLPPACLGCLGRLSATASMDLVCGPCLTRLRPMPVPGCSRCGFPTGTGVQPSEGCLECSEWEGILHGGASAFQLRPPASALVHALKYGGWEGAAEIMGSRMARLDLAELGGWTGVVVPVPTTPRRLRTRGYNQAERLARVLGRERGLPVLDALVRRAASGTQVSLHPTQRRANVENAFCLGPGYARSLAQQPVLLIDDVLTTGATVTAAARALHGADVSRVVAVTFARAVPFRR